MVVNICHYHHKFKRCSYLIWDFFKLKVSLTYLDQPLLY